MKKYIFAQESFYLEGILNDINEQGTSFLDCKHKYMAIVLAIVLYGIFTYRIYGFTSRINSKGYHSLVPGLISIFIDSMGPFKPKMQILILGIKGMYCKPQNQSRMITKINFPYWIKIKGMY